MSKWRNFYRGGNGGHLHACMAYGALASTDLNFFIAESLEILVLAVANTFQSKSTRSRWGTWVHTWSIDFHGSGLILHGGQCCLFQMILWHKLWIFMLIGKGAGCFKCHFRIFVKIRKFFVMAGRHAFLQFRVHSPRFLCNYLIFCLVLLAQITSRGDVFICILIGIFGAKSALLRGSKFLNFGQKWRWPYWPPCSDLKNKLICIRSDVMHMRG